MRESALPLRAARKSFKPSPKSPVLTVFYFAGERFRSQGERQEGKLRLSARPRFWAARAANPLLSTPFQSTPFQSLPEGSIRGLFVAHSWRIRGIVVAQSGGHAAARRDPNLTILFAGNWPIRADPYCVRISIALCLCNANHTQAKPCRFDALLYPFPESDVRGLSGDETKSRRVVRGSSLAGQQQRRSFHGASAPHRPPALVRRKVGGDSSSRARLCSVRW